MKLNKKYIFPLVLMAAYSCEKVIPIDLNSAAPQIVIEGEVTNATGPYQVKISKTVNFSSNNVFPAVSGAVVKITDNTGLTDSLTETSPGTYTTHIIKGKPGNTYSLFVSAEGKEYTSASAMPRPVPLDSISLETTRFFNDTQISAVANFKDPLGLGNYYQFIEYVNGVYVPQTYVTEDRLIDGKNIARNLYNDSSLLKTGDKLLVKMYCIDASVFSYFHTYRQVTDNSNQSASPANPVTNISNGALGYFSAHTIQSKQVTIP